jgi:phage-related minor tail protein
MAVADELIVALRTEGADETKQDLQEVDKQFQDTASKADTSSQNLSGFAAKFQGAMKVAIAALSIAAVGLLSQVPVIGEAFAGIGAIIDALIFQVDKFIRAVGGEKISEGLFNISEKIFEAEGAMGTLISVITLVVSGLAILAAALLAAGVASGTLVPTMLAGAAAIKGVVLAILGTIGTILSLPVILAAALVALAAFAVAYLTNWKGTRDKTDAIVGKIVEFVKKGFNKFVEFVGSILSPFADKVGQIFTDIADRIKQWAADLADKAVGYGEDIVRAIARGIRAYFSLITAPFDMIADAIGIDLDIGSVGGGGSTGSTSAVSGLARTGGGSTLSMDGRSLTRTTGRYESDRLTRRNI